MNNGDRGIARAAQTLLKLSFGSDLGHGLKRLILDVADLAVRYSCFVQKFAATFAALRTTLLEG
ncbi:hypothetical protein OAC41_05515, partial [Acidimicrobiales bacterium]|nr:hypothetical protein [Acidimicrobiales bacterium]